MTTHEATSLVDCHVALELSPSKWVIGVLFPGSTKVTTSTVDGGDTALLLRRLKQAQATAESRSGVEVRLRMCFESGYDGFWLARLLINHGIDTWVLGPTSLLVSRRGQRVKTDRIDVEAMVFTLKAYLLGDKGICRPVSIPTPEEEDAKRVTRERTHVVKERTRHVNRIRALLNLHGVRQVRELWGGQWKDWLGKLVTGDGRPLGQYLSRDLSRQLERLQVVLEQVKALEVERKAITAESSCTMPNGEKISILRRVSGVGEIGATLLVTEVFYRKFKNRKHLASYLGLSLSPYARGDVSRDQGISKAGNKRARVLLVELAWCWLRYQPQSRLACWYQVTFAANGGRSRKLGIVALARKLAIAPWHFVESGIIPEGATLRAA